MAVHAAALRVNVPLKPFRDVIANVSVPEFPGADTVTTGLAADRVKSGAVLLLLQPLALTKLKVLTEPRPVAKS
jgi:hypothetical protein